MNNRGWVLVVVAAALAGCVSSNSETCSDGYVCPKGDTCRIIKQSDGMDVDYCATDDQLGECGDELAPCGDGGSCHDGVCIPTVCGNMLQDVDEACDFGDTAPGNGCSADCLSTETCGNGIVDSVVIPGELPGEDCDDGDGAMRTDHDGCSSVCKAETLTWKNIHFGLRDGAAIAWDGTRGRIVLFGGASEPIDPAAFYPANVSGDTWELEDGRWELRDVGSSPAPRVRHLMAYDEERRQVVMFGGELQSGSTWTLDASGWHANASAATPFVTRFQSMAYDPVRKHVLLYGEGPAMGNNVPHDTWAWNGTTWTLLSSSLSGNNPPTSGGMAFDRKRGVMVLQGGDSTWEHDGTTWSKSTVTSPTFVFGDPKLAYDPTDQRVIVVGGGDPNSGNRKTFAFNGTAWTPLPDLPTAAAQVRDVTMATDEVTGRVVVLAQRQTLTFTGTAWKVLQSEAAPPPLYRLYAAMALDAGHHEVVMFGGQNTTFLNETWVWKGYWEKQTGTMPSARVHPSLAYDPVRDAVIMLGGAQGTDQPGIDDMWLWKNHAWGAVGGVRPPKRRGGAMAFDSKRGEMVLFGGFDVISNNATMLSDTWTWDGAQWTQKAVVSPPPARVNAAMGYDPVRERIVMFGGSSGAGGGNFLADTWEWDGATWTEAERGQQARESAGLIWDSAAKKLLLVGGQSVPFVPEQYSSEVWSFDGTWHALAASATPNPSPYVTPTIDGTGVAVLTSSTGYNGMVNDELDTVWRLRWESGAADEACGQSDTDGDGAIGCADPDCAYMCPP